jgi:hypothetical protein
MLYIDQSPYWAVQQAFAHESAPLTTRTPLSRYDISAF